MTGKGIWIVTGLELGWDCVVGVYDASTVTKEELEARFNEEFCVIHHKKLKSEVEED